MTNYQVQIFERTQGTNPEEPTRLIQRFTATAESLDAARTAVVDRLKSQQQQIHSVLYLADGSLAIVVGPGALTARPGTIAPPPQPPLAVERTVSLSAMEQRPGDPMRPGEPPIVR